MTFGSRIQKGLLWIILLHVAFECTHLVVLNTVLCQDSYGFTKMPGAWIEMAGKLG